MKNGKSLQMDSGGNCCKSCWKNSSKRQQKLILLSIAVVLLGLIIVGLYFALTVEPEICSTPTCVKTSMELRNHVDVHADPCEDFYRFACGNFLQNTDLDNRDSRSVQDIMEDEIQSQIRDILSLPSRPTFDTLNLAKKFYRACMNETAVQAEGLNRMKAIFREIGGWPTLESNWSDEDFDWKVAVLKLRKLGINFEYFFSLAVEKDKVDPERYTLYIEDPFYSPSEISTDVRNMYLDYMVDIASRFGADNRKARKDSSEVLSFLLKLAKISEESSKSNATSPYNPLSLSELQFKFPTIPWFQYINGILYPAEKVTDEDVVVVSHPVYLEKLSDLLEVTPARTLANFIAWHTLQRLINFLPGEIVDRAYEYLAKVNGKMTRKPRWRTCVKAVEDRMDSVISAAYVEKFFGEKTRYKVLKMITDIKMEFKERLMKLQWLDERTKDMALEKLLSSVEQVVSYTDLIENEEENSVYSNLKINEAELLKSALDLDYINLNAEFGKLRRPVKDNWLRHRGFITGLRIIFSPKQNILRFPVGIFRGIYYQTERPEYMNYGVLGSLIAHEISHIFIEAEYRDLQGEVRSWWSGHSLLNYEEKLQCLERQYQNFVVPEIDKHLNSSNTREEDMADLAGMKVSYDTYINWVHENGAEPRLPGLNYSPNQLFWISSAIHHCSKYNANTLKRYIDNYQQSPQQFRVNGPLQNIEEFAFDFGCPVGSPMNPIEKCRIW